MIYWWNKLDLPTSIEETIEMISLQKNSGIDNPLAIWMYSRHIEILDFACTRIQELEKLHDEAKTSYYRLQYEKEIDGIRNTISAYMRATNEPRYDRSTKEYYLQCH